MCTNPCLHLRRSLADSCGLEGSVFSSGVSLGIQSTFKGGPMSSSRGAAQNDLNDNFIGYFYYYYSYRSFAYISCFPILCFYGICMKVCLCMCVMVSFLGYFFSVCFEFFHYLFILDGCLFSNQKKKRCAFGWVGRIWE